MKHNSSDNLMNAVRVGWYNKVRRLPYYYRHKDQEYINYAVHTNVQTIRVLLEKGVSIDSLALFEVVKIKNSLEKTKMMKYLFDLGMDPNVKDNDGDSILFSIKDVDTLKFFLKCGANINVVDDLSKTLLMRAFLDNKDQSIIKFLLGFKDMIVEIDRQEKNFLHYMFEKGYRYTLDDIKMYLGYINNENINFLLNQTDIYGHNPFFYFFQRKLYKSPYYEHHLEIIIYILDTFNIHSNFYEKESQYILPSLCGMWDSLSSHTRKLNGSVLLKLLERGLNINEKDIYGRKIIFGFRIPLYIQKIIDEFYSSLDIKEPDM